MKKPLICLIVIVVTLVFAFDCQAQYFLIPKIMKGVELLWKYQDLQKKEPTSVIMREGDIIPDYVKQRVIDLIRAKNNWETKFGPFVDRAIIGDFLFFRFKASIYDLTKESEFEDPGVVVALKKVNEEDAQFILWQTMPKNTFEKINDPEEQKKHYLQTLTRLGLK